MSVLKISSAMHQNDACRSGIDVMRRTEAIQDRHWGASGTESERPEEVFQDGHWGASGPESERAGRAARPHLKWGGPTLQFDAWLRFHARLEGMLDLLHFGHQIRQLDDLRARISSRHDHVLVGRFARSAASTSSLGR